VPPAPAVRAPPAPPPAAPAQGPTAFTLLRPPPPPPAPLIGAPPWIRYARSFDANDRRPRVVVVVSELGLSSAATEAAIQQLPGGVTLAFSPYADKLAQWIDLARAAGHEVLLNLPMEPIDRRTSDPGPRALLTSLPPKQNLERLDWVLGRVMGYVGVTNHMGSRFTASGAALKPVLEAINDRGLMFLDSRATPRSVATRLATEIGLPRAINDRIIDQEASRAAIDARLADIERIARESGVAVAIGYPFPVTYERLNNWLLALEGKGLALAPITAAVNRQPDR
ncbi:MAG: divergent polysaccharide deacetylase family protein, partial [Pseudomonadota bacterium]